jgi:membrane protein required for colicin V production
MNFIDVFFLIPMVWFAYKGFSKGLIIEIAGLLALLVGIYVANHFSFYVADFLQNKMSISNKYMSIISFVITFLLVIILVILFGKMLENIAGAVKLGLVNKIIGGFFGLLKVVLVLSTLIMILTLFDIENMIIKEEIQKKSLLYIPVKKVAPAIFPKFKEYRKKMEEKLHPNESKTDSIE